MFKRKDFVVRLTVLIGLLLTMGVQAQDPGNVGRFLNYERPLIIAHRGASSLAPENTLAAVQKALDLKVDVVEIDVHRSSDGELVVLHDATLDRTTTGSGPVKQYSLEEVKSFDAGSWFSPSFVEERIPTLREVLEKTKDQATLLIELKGERTEVRTVELVKELGMTDQVIIQSFDFLQIQKAKQKAPEIPTVFLVKEPKHKEDPAQAALWMCNIADYVGASGIAVRHNLLTPELLELARERSLAVFVWTVDQQKDMKKFIKLGVQGIITNKPQDLKKLL